MNAVFDLWDNEAVGNPTTVDGLVHRFLTDLEDDHQTCQADLCGVCDRIRELCITFKVPMVL